MTDLRELEAASIRAFVGSVAYHGRVLDYGCGRQPYRDLIVAAGDVDYHGFDSPFLPGSVVERAAPSRVDWERELWRPLDETWDAIVCTQVVQYVPNVAELFADLWTALTDGGTLVMTGPTNWPEVEDVDLHRFTRAGIERLARDAQFAIERLEERASVTVGRDRLSLGWGLVAHA